PGRYPEIENFWSNWVLENPAQREVIEEARYLVLTMAGEAPFLPADGTKNEVWSRIRSSAALPEKNVVRLWRAWYSWAAVLFLMSCAGWWAVRQSGSYAPEIRTETAEAEYVKHVNNAEVAKTIILADGSSITLQPNSVLEYP